ncbi:MAG: choice-of-anchor J domain-containing protein [Ginsengibacter sp.]
MNNNKILLFISSLLLVSVFIAVSCTKDTLKIKIPVSPFPPVVNKNSSFVEEFNNVSELPAKGWIFKNNSDPVGSHGWRQGLYEATPSSKFPVPIIGFPAYSASSSPNDFISCDASSVNRVGNISSWLITPKLNMKNEDKIIFWTRAFDDLVDGGFILIPTIDRMQVLLDTTGGTPDVGNMATSTGTFSKLLLDINNGYVQNSSGGFPQVWTQYTITVSGLGSPKTNARIAFRYLGSDAGINGPNFASVVGIDQLSFISN